MAEPDNTASVFCNRKSVHKDGRLVDQLSRAERALTKRLPDSTNNCPHSTSSCITYTGSSLGLATPIFSAFHSSFACTFLICCAALSFLNGLPLPFDLLQVGHVQYQPAFLGSCMLLTCRLSSEPFGNDFKQFWHVLGGLWVRIWYCMSRLDFLEISQLGRGQW